MSLHVASQVATSRFSEVQSVLSAIKQDEPQPGKPAPVDLNARKGLAIVLLYGALEYALVRMVAEVGAIINARKVQCCHVHEPMHALIFDSELTAAENSGRSKRWEKRQAIFIRQSSSDPASIHNSAFLSEMENVWARTIAKTFAVFGNSEQPFYDVRVKQYIDVVVERRNAVAHGRESAADVGRQYTAADIQLLHDQLSKQAAYMYISFDGFIQKREFVKVPHRASY